MTVIHITTEEVKKVLRQDSMFPNMFCEHLAEAIGKTDSQVKAWLEEKLGYSIPDRNVGSVHMEEGYIVVSIPGIITNKSIPVKNPDLLL